MTASPSNYDQRVRRLLGWAVLLGGLIGLLVSLASADWHRRALFDTWQKLAPRTITADKVAVVLIDSLSLDAVGPWPWSRYYLARLTETIAAQNPKAITYDMIFAEPDALNPGNFASLYPELDAGLKGQVEQLPTLDSKFANVMSGVSTAVVLPRFGVDANGSDPAELAEIFSPITGKPPPGTLATKQSLASIPELDIAAPEHAYINGPPDDDSVVRRVPLSIIVAGKSMPGLAVELARLVTGVQTLEWRGNSLRLGGRAIPADDSGSLPIRMGYFPETATYSAAEVLAGKIEPGAFADKAVLIGLGAEGTADIVGTPLETEVFGVLIQAQAVDAILSGGWLARPAWMVWAELAAALAVLITVLQARVLRYAWQGGIALAVFVVLLAASYLAFDRANLLFDPVRPILVGVTASFAMWITHFALARAERARLADALHREQLAKAEQDGELNAARRIQLGMVPSPERLARLDPRAEIGAVLRPAKSVGGDYYDAMRVDPDTLVMIIADVTGKGVGAALYMALSKAFSKSVLGRAHGDLGEAMIMLNTELSAEPDEQMAVTLLAAKLDCATGRLTLACAGHENPIIVRSDGTVEVVKLRGGPPLRALEFPYPEETAQLAPGDTLVLITDGATEAQDSANTLLGLDGVIAALRSEGEMPATTRAADLADRIRAFEEGTEPSDDLTIVTLRYLAA